MNVALSIVIPVLDDRADLGTLLAHFERSEQIPHQVIVVSGREDATLATALAERGICYLESPPNRGAQLALGAKHASGRVVWFLHADAKPSVRAGSAIIAAVEAGAESGCFRFRFADASTWQPKLLARLVNARVRLGGIPYGDQGLFATRDAYAAAGGFAAEPLFEEVALVKALRRRGTFQCLAEPIDVAPRRWQRDGWWRRSLLNRWLAVCYTCGVPSARLASRYWPRNPDAKE